MSTVQFAAPIDQDAEDVAALTLTRRVVVIIPTLNEEASIENCVMSLMEGAAAAQFIVMDGGSDDETRSIVSRLALSRSNLSLHPNPRRSQAAAVNEGLTHAGPDRDILIRCDAHAAYPEGFVARVAQQLIATEADSITVPMDAVPAPHGGAFAKANAWAVDTRLGTGGSPHRGGTTSGYVDHGHHAGFWRARFEALGGYNEHLPANEDAEYDTRLRAAGGKVWLDAENRVTYYPRKSFRALCRQYFRYGLGRAQHHFAHRAPLRLRQLIPVGHILALTLSASLAPFTGLGWVYPIIYSASLIAEAVRQLVKRRSVAALLIPLALFGMHTAWGLGFLAGSLGAKKAIR